MSRNRRLAARIRLLRREIWATLRHAPEGVNAQCGTRSSARARLRPRRAEPREREAPRLIPIAGRWPPPGDFGLWRPTVDGLVLTDQIAAVFAAGRAAPVPVLVGSNRDEGTFFVLAAHEYQGEPLSPELYPERLRIVFGDQLAGDIAAHYPLASFASPAAALAEAIGDGVLACPTIEAGRLLARTAPVDLFQFDYRGARYALGEPTLLAPGAFHSAEIPFVFGVPEIGEFDQREAALSAATRGYWTRFAASGDPNGGGAPLLAAARRKRGLPRSRYADRGR